MNYQTQKEVLADLAQVGFNMGNKIFKNEGLKNRLPNEISNENPPLNSNLFRMVNSLGGTYNLINEEPLNEIINELITKWELFNSGFVNRRNLSIAFEYSFNKISELNENNTRFVMQEKDKLILPIIRRIFTNNTGENDIEISSIFEKCDSIIEQLRNVDIEAYFCSKFSESFIFRI